MSKRKQDPGEICNPLFVEWLTEWRDEAVNKDLNTKFTYGKVAE